VRHADATPDFLVIGHITRDLLPDGGWRLGGTATFAALTASRLGMRAAIVTSAPPDLLAALDDMLPDAALSLVPAAEATTFVNSYTPQGRQQYLRGRAAPLTLDAVPLAWRSAPIVLLGPLAQEIDAILATGFPHALVAATPQGWLRQWDETGLVSPGLTIDAANLIAQLRTLILSREDLIPLEITGEERRQQIARAEATIQRWAETAPLVVVTQGSEGATLWRHGVESSPFPGYPAKEMDPTGAGDVFAAAFLCEQHRTGDAATAVDFANRVAACSVEVTGGEGIPTREMVAARWGTP
jgi:pfkB family carbohydrate kinase